MMYHARMLLLAALSLLAGPVRAESDPCLALRPLLGGWNGVISCRAHSYQAGLVLSGKDGCVSARYVGLSGDKRERGEARARPAEKPGSFRVSVRPEDSPLPGETSILVQVFDDGRRLALSADPKAEGLTAMLRIAGTGRLNAQRRSMELRYTISSSESAAQMLAAMGQQVDDSCRGKLAKVSSKR